MHTFKSIEEVIIHGGLLLRKVMFSKFQLPDSFPYIIERDFSDEVAVEYERYVAQS